MKTGQIVRGEELMKELQESIEHTVSIIRDRQERIGRGETDMDDCFVSQRSNEQSIQEDKMKINILKNKGLHEFECLIDLETDEVISVNPRSGKFGLYWRIPSEHVDKFGNYVGYAKRESTYTRKGLKVERRTRPAWVTFSSGGGTGMMAAYTGQHVIFPSNINYYTGEPVK